jgi:cobalamin synthase
VKIHKDAVSRGAARFLLVWTALVSLCSWLGFNRLANARETGAFEYLWHGVSQENLPWLFAFLIGFLTLWSWVSLAMASIGGTWFGIVFIKLIIRTVRGER